jgi:hypothetical protein
MIMKLRFFIVLAATLALSACVVEPYGGGGYYGAPAPYYGTPAPYYSGTVIIGGGGGDEHRGGERQHDYGRHVWHP